MFLEIEDQREVWQRFANAVQSATFIKGGLFGQDRVDVAFGQHVVELSNYTVRRPGHYELLTQALVRFTDESKFRLKLNRKLSDTVLDDFRKMTGIQATHHIKVGSPEFDRKFIVKSNKPDVAQKIFTDPRVRAAAMAQSPFDLDIKIASPIRVDQLGKQRILEFRSEEFITDTRELVALCLLMQGITNGIVS